MNLERHMEQLQTVSLITAGSSTIKPTSVVLSRTFTDVTAKLLLVICYETLCSRVCSDQ